MRNTVSGTTSTLPSHLRADNLHMEGSFKKKKEEKERDRSVGNSIRWQELMFVGALKSDR